MLRQSKFVALLAVCVMMFGAVEPALAWWGEDTAYGGAVGGATGGLLGGIIGAVVAGAAVIATGGLAAIPMAGVAIGGAALTAAGYGAAGGAVVGAGIGAITDKETVNKVAKIATVTAPVVTVGFGLVPVAGLAIGGATLATEVAVTAGGVAVGVTGATVIDALTTDKTTEKTPSAKKGVLSGATSTAKNVLTQTINRKKSK